MYEENYFGIRYEAKQNEDLRIWCWSEEFYVTMYNGILHIMSYDISGRTALFSEDCELYQDNEKIRVFVTIGSRSYIKELTKLKSISVDYFDQLELNKLW